MLVLRMMSVLVEGGAGFEDDVDAGLEGGAGFRYWLV